MASNEKWKSVSVGIKTYKQLVKIAEEEDRKVGQQIANLVKKEFDLGFKEKSDKGKGEPA